MMIPQVTKAALGVAGASVLIGQAIDVQLSSAQVVGWAVGLVGFLLASLIGLVAWFASRQFEDIKGTQSQHGRTLHEQDKKLLGIESSVNVLNEWKRERTAAHEEASRELTRRLQDQVDERRKKMG